MTRAVPTWLLLDTATPRGVVALARGNEVIAAQFLPDTRKHAEALPAAVEAVLLQAGTGYDDLSGVGVGRGPGSFIGVRTGIAMSKGIALALGIPVVGLSTLEAMWLSQIDSDAATGAVLLDAKRNQHFVAFFGSTHDGTAQAIDTASLAQVVGNAAVVGHVGALPGHACDGPTPLGMQRALARALLHTPDRDEVETLVPDYVRDADAKLPAVDPSARATLAG